jgi:ADP-ribose pyrophosphatase YjhB (NUDIX family)
MVQPSLKTESFSSCGGVVPEAGCRRLPGGKVDSFGPLAMAIAREIHEELGIIIKPSDLLCVVDQIDRAEGQHWIATVFAPIDSRERQPPWNPDTFGLTMVRA